MKIVLKYYKQSIIAVLCIIGLLIVQAQFNLALPEYTSEIVDVGIQQGGIETSVPKIIGENDYNNIINISKEYNSTEEIENAYEKYDKTKIGEKENLLKGVQLKENIYVLKENFDFKTLESDFENISAKLYSLNNKNVDINKQPEFAKKQIGIQAVKNIYTNIGIDTDRMQTNYIWKKGAIMLMLALASVVVAILVGFLAAKVSARVAQCIRKDLYSNVLDFSKIEIEKFSAASLITRGTNDIQQIQQSSVMLLRMAFFAPAMAICAILKVISLKTNITWVIILAVVLVLVLVSVLMYFAIPRFKIIQKYIDKLNLVTREFITGIEVNRIFGKQQYELEKFDKANKDLTKLNLFVSRLMSFAMPAMSLIMNLIAVLILWEGAREINVGVMQIGTMMAFIQYTMIIIMSFLYLAFISVILPRAIVSANRVGEVINTKSSIVEPTQFKKLNTEGTIEFKNVCFKYEGAENCVIENINFKINKGEKLGIIGSTGSGKSTIINLIPRLVDVTEGEVLVNNVNVKNIKLKELRNIIGVVPQKAFLFTGTINENIAYANKDILNEEIKKAAEISKSTEFIVEKQKKFEENITQGGKNVSGGQKQRLSIARAIAKNPEILIFDDSFSALDMKTDKEIRKSIKKEISNKTVITVSQRINTIIDSDNILVIDNGEIVAKGNNKDLLLNCKIYRDIAESQLSKEEIENEIR